MNQVNRFIAVASGKGGVGKTTMAVNLAWGLARSGRKVCLVDADLGLGNVDIFLGLEPRYTLEHVLFEHVPVTRALIKVTDGLDVLSGGSGVPRLAALSRSQRSRLFWEFQKLGGYDQVLVDCSPGISPQVIALCLAAKELVVVVTPDATAITDSYALIKVLKENGLQFPPLVVVNNSRSPRQAKTIFEKLNHTCRRFLGQTLLFLGAVPHHDAFRLELERRRPLLELKPGASPSRELADMARRLRNRPRQRLFHLKPEDFWEKAVIQIQTRAGIEPPVPAPITLEPQEVDPEQALEILDHFLEGMLRTQARHPRLQNGFLLKLGRLAEKIETMGQRPTSQPSQGSSAPGQTVGIVAPDTEMRSLLSDIVLDTRLSPLDLLSQPSAAGRVNLVVYCLERQDLRLNAFGNGLEHVPGILLTSYPSDNHAFLRDKNIKRVITKPFNVKEIYQALEEMAAPLTSSFSAS